MKHFMNVSKYAWTTTRVFISWVLFRNLFDTTSYIWHPYKYWIQDHAFESVIVLLFIAFVYSLRESK